jgi:hypothetical protein
LPAPPWFPDKRLIAMDLPANLNDPRILGAVGVVVLLLLGGVLLWRNQRRRNVRHRLRAAALDVLEDIVVPDGDGGQLHVEFALLTPDAVLLLELRDVEGHVFGSTAMQDWTVLGERQRFTFANPQHAMLDRVAAVSRLLPDAPVEGRVAFTARARFTKGLPEHVALLEELIDDLRRDRGAREAPGIREAWDRLRSEAVAAQVGRLLRD